MHHDSRIGVLFPSARLQPGVDPAEKISTQSYDEGGAPSGHDTSRETVSSSRIFMWAG
jgi:hypothetical protein